MALSLSSRRPPSTPIAVADLVADVKAGNGGARLASHGPVALGGVEAGHRVGPRRLRPASTGSFHGGDHLRPRRWRHHSDHPAFWSAGGRRRAAPPGLGPLPRPAPHRRRRRPRPDPWTAAPPAPP